MGATMVTTRMEFHYDRNTQNKNDIKRESRSLGVRGMDIGNGVLSIYRFPNDNSLKSNEVGYMTSGW